MPPVLRESLLFPYTGGLNFVQTLQAGGWEAVNDAFANPPASTEQILHPEKYVGRRGSRSTSTLPDDLAARMGDGWKVGLEDTFGEFQLGVWLDQAAAASGGVGRERRPRPAGAATGSRSSTGRTAHGRSPSRRRGTRAEDADEFAGAATNVVDGLDGAGDVIARRRRHGA